jgi:hypothetical protein
LDEVAVKHTAIGCMLLLFACGGDVVKDDAGVCGAVPKPAPGASSSEGTSLVFVANQFFLGDADWDGAPNALAWQDVGFDLDGTSDKGCKETLSTAQGTCGIDNVYGSLQSTVPNMTRSALETSWAAAGRWTWLLKVDGFVAHGTATVSVQMFIGAPLPSAPRFDGTDVWPTAQAEDSAIVAGTVTDGVVTTGAFDTTIDEALSTDPGALHRFHSPLHVVALQFTVSSDASRIEKAVIAGTIHPEEISDLPCTPGDPPPALDNYNDVHRSLTVDSTTPCDAWSFGIGFEAVRAQLGTATAPLAAPTNCSSP